MAPAWVHKVTDPPAARARRVNQGLTPNPRRAGIGITEEMVAAQFILTLPGPSTAWEDSPTSPSSRPTTPIASEADFWTAHEELITAAAPFP